MSDDRAASFLDNVKTEYDRGGYNPSEGESVMVHLEQFQSGARMLRHLYPGSPLVMDVSAKGSCSQCYCLRALRAYQMIIADSDSPPSLSPRPSHIAFPLS